MSAPWLAWRRYSTGKLVELGHDFSQALVLYMPLLLDAGLATIAEDQLVAFDGQVPRAHSGQAVAIVLFGIARTPRTEICQVDKANHAGQHLLAADRAPPQMLSPAPPPSRSTDFGPPDEKGPWLVTRCVPLQEDVGLAAGNRQPVSMFALALIVVACWTLVRRVLTEDSPVLATALTFSLASLLTLALANASVDGPAAGLLLLATCLGFAWKLPAPVWRWPGFSLPTTVTLVLVALTVVVYANLSQNLFLDDDFWIHFPLQGLLVADGLPVRHPFFPEILMNGHYGRDLVIATVARHAGISIVDSQIWQTTLAQLGSLLTTVGLVYRCSRSELSTVLAALFVFFGINVGGRGGLVDCFQNNNALTYLLTLSILHLFHLVYLRPTWPRVCVAGWSLGVFALVYETHFGLLGLTLLVGLAQTRRRELAAIGVLALLIASVQGGPITKILRDRLNPTMRVWTPGELNQHQIVKLSFPKEELFRLQLAYGDYQRRSLAYGLLPDLGSVSAISPGTPYRPIWSWDVLKIHWLATLLAPLSLAVLLSKRDDPVGFGLWTFGALAYLIPALVGFGPIYEFEYFRWQFAAGFGFAGALGIAAGRALGGQTEKVKILLVSLLIFFNLAPTFCILFPRLIETARLSGRAWDAFGARPEHEWILAQSSKLGGFNDTDLRAAYQLKRWAAPGDCLLINSPHRKTWDIHFDSTLTGVSGVRSVGHSLPWARERVGTPPFHPSTPAQVFWRLPSLELLDQLNADWVVLRPEKTPTTAIARWLDAHARSVWQHGDYRIFQRPSKGRDSSLLAVVEASAEAEPPLVSGLTGKEQTAELFLFDMEEDGRLWAWGFVDRGAPVSTVDLHEVVTWRSGPCAGMTPPYPGDYDLIFFEVVSGNLRAAGQRIPYEVTERTRRSR